MTCLVEGLYVKLTFLLREIWEETFPLCKKNRWRIFPLPKQNPRSSLRSLFTHTNLSFPLSSPPAEARGAAQPRATSPRPRTAAGGRAQPRKGGAQPRGAAPRPRRATFRLREGLEGQGGTLASWRSEKVQFLGDFEGEIRSPSSEIQPLKPQIPEAIGLKVRRVTSLIHPFLISYFITNNCLVFC